MIIILLSVLIGIFVATLACTLPGQTTSPAMAQNESQSASELETEFTRVAEQVLPAVVRINVEAVAQQPQGLEEMPEQFKEFFRQFPWFQGPEGEDGMQPMPRPRQGVGSGWIYSEDGYIVTNAHVVRDATEVTVVLHDRPNDDTEYPATVVGTDPRTDLAVVKVDVDRQLPKLSLGSSKNLKVASWVMAVGAPFEFEQTVTVGVVSAKGRLLTPDPTNPYIRLGDLIQTDASINPGNSGGPLVNLRGEVVGINVAYAAPMRTGNIGIGFAIPADTASRIVPQLIEGRRIARGWLGIQIEDLSHNLKQFYGVEHGVRVMGIDEDGPAAASDLREDDIITAVEDEPINDTWDLQSAIANRNPNETVTLTVVRNRQERQIKVKLGEMPARYAGLEDDETAGPAQTREEWPLGIAVMPISELTPEIGQRLGIEAEQGAVVGIEREQGVVVTSVAPTSPAAEKVQEGDVVAKVNGNDIKSVEDFRTQMQQAIESDRGFVVLHLTRVIDGRAVTRAVDIEL